eukprot:3716405-Amphidinium_carterae.1
MGLGGGVNGLPLPSHFRRVMDRQTWYLQLWPVLSCARCLPWCTPEDQRTNQRPYMCEILSKAVASNAIVRNCSQKTPQYFTSAK